VPRLLVPPKEAAEMLDISVKTLRALTDDGQIKYVLVGARRKYEPDDLKEFIQRGKACPSTGRRSRRTGTMTSKSRVYDFTAARERRISARRSDAKRKSGARPPRDESDQPCP